MASVTGVLAVDLGGTNLRVAAVSADGRLLHRESIPTNDELGPASVIERMGALCQRVADRAGLGPDAPIGVASPGPLDPRTGVVLFTPNLQDWLDIPLASELSRYTGRQTRIANDANCAGLGEARFGAAVGYRNIVYIGLGTGVGGGVIIDGEMYEGGLGLGVELGHVCVALDGPRCTCGAIGCLEAYAAGWAIAHEAALVAGAEDGGAIRAASHGREPDARAVTEAALANDPAALAILNRAGRALGAAIGVFINIFNPEAVVIGGGLAVSGEAILGPARAAIPSYSFRGLRNQAAILRATLGDDNGLIGAAAIALDL
jgi:glucokinase